MQSDQFSGPVNVFRDSRLPEPATPVGYAALVGAYGLKVPLPLELSAVGTRHKVYRKYGWQIYTPRHAPRATLEGHLVFALKYEGLDLAVLKRLFDVVPPAEIEAIIRGKPTSSYTRRIWFLYEWLLGRELDLPDAKTGTYAEVIDQKLQWAVKGQTSTRHRVWNNLPGTPEFCPLVRRTTKLEELVNARLDEKARTVVGRISARVLVRTAAFLLLKDSRSSYAIEGESPPQNRIQRWGKVIGEAGKHGLDQDEILRLQRIVIGDERFVHLGFRLDGGFVGEHEPGTRLPLPDHISARHQDISGLIQGMIDFEQTYASGLDPVIAAAVLAFGFVYAHPFEDGNGRLHRYLIHHVLAARGFNPRGVVFPVSFAILERIDDYRQVLETYSQRILPLVEWEATEKMNVRVLNDTGDFYRYFDATPHAEFLFECVQKTIENDLPDEIVFLERYDQFKAQVEAIVDMPTFTVDLLFNFLNQNAGILSKRAREKEFLALTGEEFAQFEKIYCDLFLV